MDAFGNHGSLSPQAGEGAPGAWEPRTPILHLPKVEPAPRHLGAEAKADESLRSAGLGPGDSCDFPGWVTQACGFVLAAVQWRS